jgi:hypothetical protein
MKKYIEKSKIDKKLCIHCKYHVLSDIVSSGYCGFIRNMVDDNPSYSALRSRESIHLCGFDGLWWEINEGIVVTKSEEEAKKLRTESLIQSYMEMAKERVENQKKIDSWS